MQIVSDVQKSVAIPKLPKTTNKALKHDAAGVLGLSGPNTFYLTLQKKGGLDGKYAALGKVIAGRRSAAGAEEGRRRSAASASRAWVRPRATSRRMTRGSRS